MRHFNQWHAKSLFRVLLMLAPVFAWGAPRIDSVVSIRYDGRHWCGGVAVSADTVATAAHCLNRAELSRYSVAAFDESGGLLTPPFAVLSAVTYCSEHHSKDQSPEEEPLCSSLLDRLHDIALVRVVVQDDRELSASELPTESTLPSPEAERLTGFGSGLDEQGTPALTLTAFELTQNNHACMHLHDFTPAFLLCTSGPASTCPGDSGSPVYARSSEPTLRETRSFAYATGVTTWLERAPPAHFITCANCGNGADYELKVLANPVEAITIAGDCTPGNVDLHVRIRPHRSWILRHTTKAGTH